MVGHLADQLIDRYATGCKNLLDPFCGSGAILTAAQRKGIQVAGMDINPYATLLTRVKLEGFDVLPALEICEQLLRRVRVCKSTFPVVWPNKNYWFGDATLHKYERLRFVAHEIGLHRSRDGRAVLLAFALSIRRCSPADQRSPKPFISELARRQRKGRHFDPLIEIPRLLCKLASLYGRPSGHRAKVILGDVRQPGRHVHFAEKFSHIVTSPPYINAQDYFRNFKLELYLLEGLIPYKAEGLKDHFIGKERGNLTEGISREKRELHFELLSSLGNIQQTHPVQALVVHRYLDDMAKALGTIKNLLLPSGTLVLVCGDNLVAGHRIPTWRVLNRLLEQCGFRKFDSFGDSIERRYVPPKRHGHKGLIKREVVSAFTRY
jgi:methylase of polypeptide subunit release factors